MSHKRFEDLLRLTLSDNDNEALLALRMVQKMAGGDLTSYIAAYPKLKHDDRFETLKADLESKNKIIVELKEEIQRLRKIMSLNDTTDLRQEASPAKVLSDWIKKSIVFPSDKAWPWTATNELFESFSRYYEATNCERKRKTL
ncbi:MAG: hypothetical protein EOO20_20965 [Chryseobacterium sp.]|nr:MAG: hypothetical protein EOO20_20965 [Chryseobacterium sp.]